MIKHPPPPSKGEGPTQTSTNPLMTALCLNVPAEMQHADSFIKVQKKPLVKKKGARKHVDTHLKSINTPPTTQPVAVVFTMLQGPHVHCLLYLPTPGSQ